MDLRRRLDRLVETFTEELLGLISTASLEELVGKGRARELRRQAEREAAHVAAAARKATTRPKPVKAPARAAKPVKPARAPTKPSREARGRAERPRAVAPSPKLRTPSVRPPAPAAPDRRTVERALVGALRHGLPMGEADLFDAAALGSDAHALAREALEGLVERGVFGKSALVGGATLFFAKPPQRRTSRPRREAIATAAPSQPQSQPAAEPWRPVVLRRKKGVPGAPVETITPAPTATTMPTAANDGESSAPDHK